jgi:arylsulfatase A-like enzyme
MPTNLTTVADLFRTNDYTTHAVGKWHLGERVRGRRRGGRGDCGDGRGCRPSWQWRGGGRWLSGRRRWWGWSWCGSVFEKSKGAHLGSRQLARTRTVRAPSSGVLRV